MESSSEPGAETVGDSAQHTQLRASRPRSTRCRRGFLPESFLVLLLDPTFHHHKLRGQDQGISKVLMVCGSMTQRCLPLAKSKGRRGEDPATGCSWECRQWLCLLSFCSTLVQWFPKVGPYLGTCSKCKVSGLP